MTTATQDRSSSSTTNGRSKVDLLAPLRNWLDRITIHHPRFARLICRLIPCRCAFERDIRVFGKTYHIPALCKLNPLYDELIGLRFRALIYLTDVCGEDVKKYTH
jgi:hypothetical protein